MKSNNVTVDSSGNADSSFSTFYNWVTQTDSHSYNNETGE